MRVGLRQFVNAGRPRRAYRRPGGHAAVRNLRPNRRSAILSARKRRGCWVGSARLSRSRCSKCAGDRPPRRSRRAARSTGGKRAPAHVVGHHGHAQRTAPRTGSSAAGRPSESRRSRPRKPPALHHSGSDCHRSTEVRELMTASQDQLIPLNIRDLLNRRLCIETTYSEREVMLYAISLGLGRDPLDAASLRFVYEDGLQVIPTFATILSFSARLMRPTDGLDVGKLLHGEQRLVLDRPLPPQGTAVIQARIKEMIDKGPGRGLLIIQEVIVSLKETGERLAAVEGTGFYRADGGRAGTTGS